MWKNKKIASAAATFEDSAFDALLPAAQGRDRFWRVQEYRREKSLLKRCSASMASD